MSDDAKTTIEIIKSGKLPEIKSPKIPDHKGLSVSTRGLQITSFTLKRKNNTPKEKE